MKILYSKRFLGLICIRIIFDSAAIERSIWQPLNHPVLSFHQYQCSIHFAKHCCTNTPFFSVPLFTLSTLCFLRSQYCVVIFIVLEQKIKWRKQRIWWKKVHWNRKNALEYLCAWKWRAFFSRNEFAVYIFHDTGTINNTQTRVQHYDEIPSGLYNSWNSSLLFIFCHICKFVSGFFFFIASTSFLSRMYELKYRINISFHSWMEKWHRSIVSVCAFFGCVEICSYLYVHECVM